MRKLENGQNMMDLSEREAQILLDEGVAVELEAQGRKHVLQLQGALRWEDVQHLIPGYD